MIRRALAAFVLCLLLLGVGIFLGAHPQGLPGFVRNTLVGDQDVRVVREAIDDVHGTYYRQIPRAQLANASITGMVRSLDDRFSHYFDPKEYAQFEQQQSGEFAGVGISVTKDPAGLRVVQVFDKSPARRAGLTAGDVITAVGGTSLRGKSNDASVALIKGPIGTDVRLTVRHDGRLRRVSLTRSTIEVPVVSSSQRTVDGKKLAVVRLDEFSSGAHAELATALRKALRDHDRGIVLDLRGNPGGLVSEAQLVASEFLRDGTIVTTRGRNVPTRTLSATGEPVAPKIPLVVLVDRNTASAAEIVSGALQDRHRAQLVGTRTFGKGVFQEVIELSNGGALDITAGQYFLPSGRNLGGKGVNPGSGLTPDVRAPDDPKTKVDESLQAALGTLAREA